MADEGVNDVVIYGIQNTGDLRWFKHNDTNVEAYYWSGFPASGYLIGTGWQPYKHVFSGGRGIIYGVDSTNNMRWFKDQYRIGTTGFASWAPGSGNIIDTNWHDKRYTKTKEEFGYRSMSVGTPPKPATGVRKLLGILAEYNSNPPFSSIFPSNWHSSLLFGDQAPPFSGGAGGVWNPASVKRYFRENSNGRFEFGPAVGGAGTVTVAI